MTLDSRPNGADTEALRSRAASMAEAWAAASVTLVSAVGEGSANGTGGGLADALARGGVAALGASLGDGERVELRDGDAHVVLSRHGSSGLLRVSWLAGPAYEQRVPLGAPLVVTSAPALLPPPKTNPPGPLGAPVPDVVAALADNKVPLAVVDGKLYYHDSVPPERRDGVVPPVSIADLGSPAFLRAHGVRAAYIAGAMAGGIASVDLVTAMGRAGMLGFFGSGGLPVHEVERALAALSSLPEGTPWGCNLLHNPNEPAVEEQTVDLLLRYKCRKVSASAFMTLTPAIVRYRAAGLSASPTGEVREQNAVFAKVSRTEVAARFLAPPPADMLAHLVSTGAITAEQARMAATLPIAGDVTAEADSGGHTDRRPLPVLLPLMLRLRDAMVAEHGWKTLPRVGAAGGLGDPASVYGAFAMGADYVLTGSINQACVEAGTSARVKAMLADATMADVAMGPAPDMFEIGANVQVLAKGTMYAQRARRLYEVYKGYDGIEDIPPAVRERLESKLLMRTIDDIWADTRAYWSERDPQEVNRAERDAKHHMALVFRWYLGMTSRWARVGDDARVRDYQIWCGPSIGLFNAWALGGPFAALPSRRVADLAVALLTGAAVLRRQEVARALGVRFSTASSVV